MNDRPTQPCRSRVLRAASFGKSESSGPTQGLSENEAAARLKAEGPNTLPQADRRTFIRIILEILREPMFALLLGAAVIYLLLGDLKEAVVLGLFACTSVFIAFVQESRSERLRMRYCGPKTNRYCMTSPHICASRICGSASSRRCTGLLTQSRRDCRSSTMSANWRF